MSYVILKSEQRAETIVTTVVFTIDGVQLSPIEIPHFMPESKDSIIQGIENRELSEKKKLDAVKNNEQILKDL